MKLLHDTWLIYTRMLLITARNPIRAYMGLFQPICFLLLFAPLVRTVTQVPGFPPGGSLAVFTPGLLVIMAMYSCAFVGFSLIADMRLGVIERFRVTPVSRLALLLGRSLRDVTILAMQLVIIIVLTVLAGLQLTIVGMLLACILVLLVGLIVSSFSYSIALALKTEDGLAPTINFFLLPAQLLSGFMLPLSFAPIWLQYVALLNPLSYAVNASRALFIGNLTDPSVFIAFGVMGIMALVTFYGTTQAFKKTTT